MHPPRVVGLVLATASIAQAVSYMSSDRIPHLERRADDAKDQASSTVDNIISDLLPSNTATTNQPETTDDSKTTQTEKSTEKPPDTTKDDSTPTPTPTAKTTTTDPSPTPTPTTNPTPAGDDASSPSPTTPTVPPPTSTQPADGDGANTTNDGNNSPAPTPTGNDSGNDSGSADDHTVVTDTPSVIVETRTTVITTTNAAGQEVVETTTTRTTTTPDLNDGGDADDAAKGMSPETKRTVIGVVVGVGGAIVVGALGFVAWRLHGRKKNVEESDGLMSYDPNGHRSVEKLDVSGSNAAGSMGSHPSAVKSPFQSTLEDYHRPTQVSTSANF